MINGPGWARDANLLYVEWCTGEQELYNMTIDPHQVTNIVESTDLTIVNSLSHLVAHLGKCSGHSCYVLEEYFVGGEQSLISRRLTSREEIQKSVRDRLPCHNPPNMSACDLATGRKLFAIDLPVPEPFQFGFPFSDGEEVPTELMNVWRQHEHYFY